MTVKKSECNSDATSVDESDDNNGKNHSTFHADHSQSSDDMSQSNETLQSKKISFDKFAQKPGLV